MQNRPKIICDESVDMNERWGHKKCVWENTKGENSEYHYGESNGHSLVVGHEKGKILLVRRFGFLHEKNSVEFPTRRLLIDEIPSKAASRALDKTGYTTDDFIKIGEFEPLIDLFRCTVHVFMVSDLTQGKKTPAENWEVIWRRPDEVDEMVKRGEIWDGRSLAAWLLAKDNLR